MTGSWTFQRRLSAGITLLVLLTLVLAAVSVYALRSVVDSHEQVMAVHVDNQLHALELGLATERTMAATRGFLLTGSPRFMEVRAETLQDFERLANQLEADLVDPTTRAALDDVRRAAADSDARVERLIALGVDADPEVLARVFDDEVAPVREQLRQSLDVVKAREGEALRQGRQSSSDTATLATWAVTVLGVVVLLLALGVAWALSAALGRQVGAAVSQVQSASAELQAASHQQASSAQQQASSMAEISTTLRELLSTSRQIAEGAQQVAGIASSTEQAARQGETAIGTSRRAADEIRAQMDEVVQHMLDLGRKAQQVGTILDLVNELTEQTNIVSINATIEAAGAGEQGRRFAVVAEELRRLADRLGSSNKEIRGLVEEVRAAVNSAVMATETGSKAVDANNHRFDELTRAFGRIVELVETSAEAAREIELSTKQQTSAVEQVNAAMADVSQAAQETGASTRQMLQTASELASLSEELARLAGSGRR